MTPYYVFFSGAVAVGKSSLMASMKLMLARKKFIMIKEFIDYQPNIGELLLSQNKAGKISDFEFQNYVLDCYEAQLNKITNEEFVLMERHPLEALGVFVKCAIFKMPFEHQRELEDRIHRIMEKFQVPDLRDCNMNKYNSSLFTIKSIVEDFNIQLIKHYSLTDEQRKYGDICYLETNVDDMILRIVQRGRQSEKTLNGADLASYASGYEMFFKNLKLI